MERCPAAGEKRKKAKGGLTGKGEEEGVRGGPIGTRQGCGDDTKQYLI